MKVRQHLGALALTLAAGVAFTPNVQLSAQNSDRVPESAYIGREIGYPLEDVINPFTQMLRLTGSGPLGDDNLMSIVIYHNEKPEENERIFHMLTEEEFPSYPNLNQEESKQYTDRLNELFHEGALPVMAQYHACPPPPLSVRPVLIPEGWTPIDHKGVTHIVHIDPFLVYKNKGEDELEFLLSRNNDGIISNPPYGPEELIFYCPSSNEPVPMPIRPPQ